MQQRKKKIYEPCWPCKDFMIHSQVNLHLANGNLMRCHGVSYISNYVWLTQSSSLNQEQKLKDKFCFWLKYVR